MEQGLGDAATPRHDPRRPRLRDPGRGGDRPGDPERPPVRRRQLGPGRRRAARLADAAGRRARARAQPARVPAGRHHRTREGLLARPVRTAAQPGDQRAAGAGHEDPHAAGRLGVEQDAPRRPRPREAVRPAGPPGDGGPGDRARPVRPRGDQGPADPPRPQRGRPRHRGPGRPHGRRQAGRRASCGCAPTTRPGRSTSRSSTTAPASTRRRIAEKAHRARPRLASPARNDDRPGRSCS